MIVAFASATVFLRTRYHTATVEDGRNFLSYLFYSAYFMNATGWSELSITVRGAFILPLLLQGNFNMRSLTGNRLG